MGKAMLAVIHVNAQQPHQVRMGEALAAGFMHHGVRCEMTADRTRAGDMHVVLGPHYAADVWRGHPRTLLLDIGFVGDPAQDVSLGWMIPGGGRRFPAPDPDRYAAYGTQLADLRPRRGQAVMLGDYVEDHEIYRTALTAASQDNNVRYRRHPEAPAWPACPVSSADHVSLHAALADADLAIGYRTSALVTAGLEGLHVTALAAGEMAAGWRAEPAERLRWAWSVAGATWSESEIAAGDAWPPLVQCAP